MNTTKPIPAASTTTIEDIHPDLLFEALSHLDGPSLASASFATSHLRSISSHPDLWRRLCLSTWPSLHHPRLLPLLESCPRQFFSDAYLFSTASAPADESDDLPNELISAIDLYHRGVPIFSRAIETDTSTSTQWFRASPFVIDAPAAVAAMPLEDLTLSWIVIDPIKRRAVNVSSRRAVERRNWCKGGAVARFATVWEEHAVCAVVALRKGTGDVIEVGLTMEDMDGVCVSGREGLRMVKAAMEAGRRGKGEEEAKGRYLEYLRMKRSREESRVMRERFVELCCAAFGVLVFLAFLFLFIFR